MSFFPKNPKFFDMFCDLGELVKETGLLVPSQIKGKDIAGNAKKARKLERKAAKLRHEIDAEASSTFITPIDREDIHTLVRNLDNIVDKTETVISNIMLFQITSGEPEYKQLIAKLHETTTCISHLMVSLKGKERGVTRMKAEIAKIHTLENDADDLYQRGVYVLFTKHKDPLLLLKWKDIFTQIEAVFNQCEDAADVMSEIIIKNY